MDDSIGVAVVKESSQGKAVQVDPVKSTLKPPGTTRLKLKYDKLLSSFSFKFNLRRYTKECSRR